MSKKVYESNECFRKNSFLKYTRFFRNLRYEQLNDEKFRTKESVKLSIIDYLAFYNGKGTHSKLSYQSPIQYEWEIYKQSV